MDDRVRPLQKNHHLVTMLTIVDQDGNPIQKPIRLAWR